MPLDRMSTAARSLNGVSSVAFFSKRLQGCEQEIKELQRQLRNAKSAKNRAEKRAAELDDIFEKKLEHHTSTRVALCEKEKDAEIAEWKKKYADLLMKTQGMTNSSVKLVSEEDAQAMSAGFKMEKEGYRNIVNNLTDQNKALTQAVSRMRRKQSTLATLSNGHTPVTRETIEEWRSLCKHFIIGKWVNNVQMKKKLKEVLRLMMHLMKQMSALFMTDPNKTETIVALDEEPEVLAWIQASKFMQRKGSTVTVWGYLKHMLDSQEIVDQTLALCAEREKKYQKLTNSVFDRNADMASEILDLQNEMANMDKEKSFLNDAIAELQTEMRKGQAKMETRIRMELQKELEMSMQQSEQRLKVIQNQNSKLRMMRVALDRYKQRVTELTGKTALSTVQKMIEAARQRHSMPGGSTANTIEPAGKNAISSFGVPIARKPASSHKNIAQNSGPGDDPWSTPGYEHVLKPSKPTKRAVKSPRTRRPRTAQSARGSPRNSSRFYPNPYLEFDPSRI